jgi:hypothetical protein
VQAKVLPVPLLFCGMSPFVRKKGRTLQLVAKQGHRESRGHAVNRAVCKMSASRRD